MLCCLWSCFMGWKSPPRPPLLSEMLNPSPGGSLVCYYTVHHFRVLNLWRFVLTQSQLRPTSADVSLMLVMFRLMVHDLQERSHADISWSCSRVKQQKMFQWFTVNSPKHHKAIIQGRNNFSLRLLEQLNIRKCPLLTVLKDLICCFSSLNWFKMISYYILLDESAVLGLCKLTFHVEDPKQVFCCLSLM